MDCEIWLVLGVSFSPRPIEMKHERGGRNDGVLHFSLGFSYSGSSFDGRTESRVVPLSSQLLATDANDVGYGPRSSHVGRGSIIIISCLSRRLLFVFFVLMAWVVLSYTNHPHTRPALDFVRRLQNYVTRLGSAQVPTQKAELSDKKRSNRRATPVAFSAHFLLSTVRSVEWRTNFFFTKEFLFHLSFDSTRDFYLRQASSLLGRSRLQDVIRTFDHSLTTVMAVYGVYIADFMTVSCVLVCVCIWCIQLRSSP
ncbi:hypothetical protein OUZ56_008278 [Daphnia magna]|uniref:Uncharacterized protein n=1 Tax=Daphnia magna TaxID=35525 RepID=A0ABR0ACJ4_9CRUS|nr:hypothetical protein OUZ56_008278 [Daphnia magna]